MRTKTIKGTPCQGVPTEFDPSLPVICDSRGVGRWKKIVVGREFFAFDGREQQALILHEVGHCKLRHLEKRLVSLWLLLWSPKKLRELCLAQEYEADLFAARCGFGADLARAFMRLQSHSPDPLHPPLRERISRLQSVA